MLRVLQGHLDCILLDSTGKEQCLCNAFLFPTRKGFLSERTHLFHKGADINAWWYYPVGAEQEGERNAMPVTYSGSSKSSVPADSKKQTLFRRKSPSVGCYSQAFEMEFSCSCKKAHSIVERRISSYLHTIAIQPYVWNRTRGLKQVRLGFLASNSYSLHALSGILGGVPKQTRWKKGENLNSRGNEKKCVLSARQEFSKKNPQHRIQRKGVRWHQNAKA